MGLDKAKPVFSVDCTAPTAGRFMGIIASSTAFVDALRESQLIDSVLFNELTPEFIGQHADPRALARVLVEWEWLSRYQVDIIFQGRANELVLGPYRLLEPLGEGGMGQVFKAVQQRLDRIVALKIIRPEKISQDVEVVRRFQREARATAAMLHPNIVVVYDADQVGNTHFIAMEYVAGHDLSKMVRQSGPLDIGRACEYIRQAALGLQHAHECGLVHRDIKPSNLLVTTPPPPRGSAIKLQTHRPPQISGGRSPGQRIAPRSPTGVVKILDMGLARVNLSEDGQASSLLTQYGMVIGTPAFIAPEQARNPHQVDIRADLYGLGATLYYMLTGQTPFPGGSVVETLLRHQTDEPKPVEQWRPDIPFAVARVVRRLMAKDPAARYQTPGELAEIMTPLAALVIPSAPTVAPSLVPSAPTEKGDFGHALSTPTTGDNTASPLAQTIDRASLVAAPPAAVNHVESPAEQRPKFTEQTPRPSMAEPHGLSATVLNVAVPVGPQPAQRTAKLKGPQGWVSAVAFSPDRHWIASGEVGGGLRLWGFGKEAGDHAVPQAHIGDTTALSFFSDGKILASGAGGVNGVVRIWDVTPQGPQPRLSLPAPNVNIAALAFAPTGHFLALACGDGSARVWDLANPRLREANSFKGRTVPVDALIFTPDGKGLVTGSRDGNIRIWSLSSSFWNNKGPVVLEAHRGEIRTLAITRDGLTLASAGVDHCVRLWDLSGPKPRERAVLEGHTGTVRALRFVDDGGTLVSADDGGRVYRWDSGAASKAREWLLPGLMVCSLDITRDGRYVATGTTEGTILVYRLYPKGTRP
jgi:serine/threonine-protein kinase